MSCIDVPSPVSGSVNIPKIRPPPQSPRRSRPSSTHSACSLNPEVDFITFDTQPTPHPIQRSSQSLRVTSRSAAATRRKNQRKEGAMPGSASLVLPFNQLSETKPMDPVKWREYIEASFPVIEDKGDIVIKLESTESHKQDKIKDDKKTSAQVNKIKQYSKLKQQSSVEDSFKSAYEDSKNKADEMKSRQDDSKATQVSTEGSISVAEKRKRFLLRKQTQSAPDTGDMSEGDVVSASASASRARKTAHLCMGGRCRARGSDSSIQHPSINLEPDVGIEHLDDLKYPDGDAPCHFCEKDFSQSIHDEARLKIVSGGLIQTRDGSSGESRSQYMNLPSPMLQCEEGSHVSFQQRLDGSKNVIATTEDDDVLPEEQVPPPSVLIRRKALVSSNLRTDAQRHQLSLDEFARRSSTVVYPEMQICPGDLMVYSKALINSQLVKEKGKKSKCKVDCDHIIRRGTWSILRIFDRHRKAGSITGLEAFLDGVKRDFFDDACLAKYRGMTWSEFYSKIAKERKRGHRKKDLSMEGRSPYESDEGSSDSYQSDTCDEKDGIIILPEKDSDRLSNENDFDDDQDQRSEDEEDDLSGQENDQFVMTHGSFRSERKDFDFDKKTLKSKCRSTEFSNQSFKFDDKSKPRKLLRAQSSQQFSSSALGQLGKFENSNRPKELPKILRRGESSRQLLSKSPKASPKLSRQLSDLFKKKESIEKVWIDKGKAEKQETAMTRFQKRLTRTQSERVMGICRLASWRQKERPIPEPENAVISPVSTVSQGEYKRREAVWDIYQTECVFLFDHLTVLKCVFMEPLKSAQVEGFLMFAEPQLLFGNLDELCRVTRNFCRSFIRLLTKQVGPSGELPTIQVLEGLFKKNEDGDMMTQAYHSYALNYINALTYLETLRSYEAFNVFEKWCATDKRCRKLQLTDFLVAPVQHIMKIPLLLKEILTRTDNGNEVVIIGNILEMEEKSIRQLDDKMKWLKNYEHLLELQKNITWPSALDMEPKLFVPEFIKPALKKQVCDRVILSPRRKIINEGQLNCWDSGKPQEMILLLFDDMLLITKKKKGLKKSKAGIAESLSKPCHCGSVYKQPLSLDRIHLYEPSLVEMLASRIDHSFLLIVVNRFQQVVTIHTFQASNHVDKENWITRLREAQENFKKNLETTIFRSSSPPTVSVAPEHKVNTLLANSNDLYGLEGSGERKTSKVVYESDEDCTPRSAPTAPPPPPPATPATPQHLQIVDKRGRRKKSV